MTKNQLRLRLHWLNPYAGYNSSYGNRLTKEQLERTLARYEALQRGEHPTSPRGHANALEGRS